MTELLLSAEVRSSTTATIDPVLTTLRAELVSLCSARPSLQVLVAPPLFRVRPAWYQQSLPWIASQFSSVICDSRPPNLHLLPSLINPELAPDGVHLTPVSGLYYVIHLFDQSVSTLATIGAAQDQQLVSVRENVRLHDDRISYLESRHVQLNHRVNLKTTEDAEFDDWQRNRSFEDWFTIQGLPRLSSELNNRDWQHQA